MALRSTNPALSAKVFEQYAGTTGETMTLEGTINKSAFLLFLVVVAASWPWYTFFRVGGDAAVVIPYLIGGMLGGLVFAIATIVKKTWAPLTAPLYAACEGLALGAVSALYESQLSGIVFQAIGLTFGTLAIMLVAYRTGIIKVTDRFRMGVVAATGSIALLYLVSIGLSFFGIQIPFIHQSGTFGILFSLFVVAIAALNLVLDFDNIATGVQQGAPKVLEWYGAFGLMVTLIWLYLEILRLLSKLRRR